MGTWTKGLDDLDKRAAEAYAQGARFAKWRNVLQIDPAKNLPSDLAIAECVHNLSRYAAVCQRNGLCPIVEPEIVPNGSHGIDVCTAVTEKVLAAQFASLEQHQVYLEGAVLKPNMVKPGLDGPQASPEQVATATMTTLLKTVKGMPGVFFLSGETRLDEDNEETATINLNAMNRDFKDKPTRTRTRAPTSQALALLWALTETSRVLAVHTRQCTRDADVFFSSFSEP